ncbi:MAG: hypothetical protein WC525_09150 [Candidatus Thermoplasmatota archaeon]
MRNIFELGGLVAKAWGNLAKETIKDVPRAVVEQMVQAYIEQNGSKPTDAQIRLLVEEFSSDDPPSVRGTDAEQYALSEVRRNIRTEQKKLAVELTKAVAQEIHDTWSRNEE